MINVRTATSGARTLFKYARVCTLLLLLLLLPWPGIFYARDRRNIQRRGMPEETYSEMIIINSAKIMQIAMWQCVVAQGGAGAMSSTQPLRNVRARTHVFAYTRPLTRKKNLRIRLALKNIIIVIGTASRERVICAATVADTKV